MMESLVSSKRDSLCKQAVRKIDVFPRLVSQLSTTNHQSSTVSPLTMRENQQLYWQACRLRDAVATGL
jgi:hypothetical protein